MTTEAAALIRSSSDLSPGDRVEAHRNDLVLYRGKVLATVPELDLIWILDNRTGTRQLLDLEQLRVLRCPVRALPSLTGSGSELPGARLS